MKPLNADNPGCSPISSDCVIWQGPDIECINLCKGDTVSNVVYKIAVELCAIMDTLDIDSYDIACLTIDGCAPEDFHALIQLLITKICDLEEVINDPAVISPSTGTGTTIPNSNDMPVQTRILAGIPPNTVIAIPKAFQYINPQGDTVTAAQLVDIATASMNKIQDLINGATTTKATLTNHNQRLNELESIPAPTLSLPTIIPVCVLPAVPQALDLVVIELEKKFCELQSATGLPAALYAAYQAQCTGLNQLSQLNNPGSDMQSIPGWVDSVTNAAGVFNNLWLSVCDIQAAIRSIQFSCCTSTNCDDLNVTLQGVLSDPNTLKLYFAGSVPLGFAEANPLGSQVTITDAAGNSMTINVLVTANLNNPDGYSVALAGTPLNGLSNLAVAVNLDYTDGESQCARVITDVVLATGNCPTVILSSPSETTIDWSFTYLGGPGSIDVVLYDATGAVQLQNQVSVVAGPQTLGGSFAGLLGGVQYKIRLEILVDGAIEETLCPFGNITTTTPACIPPTSVNAVINIT